MYLYAQGTSKRPPPIQISTEALHRANCTALAPIYNRATSRQEIYVGAPKYFTRQDTFRWHLTTRNFFAWLTGKPLAGAQLGVALADLLVRMEEYRSQDVNNEADLLAFAQEMGYMQLAHQPDHAVAMLVFAERQHSRPLWINAFSHCVGMNGEIVEAPDFETLSTTNRALIAKAATQMDVALEAKCRSIGIFLEEELANQHIGLTTASRDHLDHFRTFLQSQLVARYGYWPPLNGYDRALYSSLHDSFDNLHRYLADFSAGETSSLTAFSGSLYVRESFANFNRRMGYPALEPSLPRLPTIVADQARRPSIFARRQKMPSVDAIQAAHLAATNQEDPNVLNDPLVRAYAGFEQERSATLVNKVSWEEGRKVRWVLICAMLQTLSSVVRSSPEVTGKKDVSYPLCCSISELPSWCESTSVASWTALTPAPKGQHPAERAEANQTMHSPALSLHPDGETDYEGYFSRKGPIALPEPSSVERRPRIQPLRTRSIRQSFFGRPSKLTRSWSRSSLSPASRIEDETFPPLANHHTPQVPDSPAKSDDSPSTPSSEVPSLDWSRHSRRSGSSVTSADDHASHSSTSLSSYQDPLQPKIPMRMSRVKHKQDLALAPKNMSSNSSVYSERFGVPPVPARTKTEVSADALDKGLAWDFDTIIPGLS